MEKKNQTKKASKKKQTILSTSSCLVLVTMVLLLSYFVFQTNLLEPKLNTLTTSYISFNNKNTTDMLKISNLQKMTNRKGQSKFNEQGISFEVSGNEKQTYEVVLYPLTNQIDTSYIHFTFESKEGNISGTLNQMEEKEDGGFIIYTGTISKKESKKTIRMWIDKKYKANSNHTSFEVKIESR